MALSPLLLALPWALPFAVIPRLARRVPRLLETPPVTGEPLTVIIPARNESRAIGTVVRSVLASTYAPLEVIVVDDRSSDDTAAQVEQLAATDARLRLVRGAELPEASWFGKPWACVQGVRAATGTLLCFTDADTRHAPPLLAHAVGALRASGAALVTIAPRQLCLGFWERVIMPQIWFLLGLRYTPSTVNGAVRGRDVIANGQFILVRRDAYERVGGHAAVRHEVAEDVALAQRFHAAGARVHLSWAEELMETRMYASLGEIVEGWSKNVYLGGQRTYPDEPVRRALVPALLLSAFLVWLVPALAVLLGGPVLRPAALAAFGLASAFWALISFGMQLPPWYGLLHPLGALLACYIVLRSTVRGRHVTWRGRTYTVAR